MAVVFSLTTAGRAALTSDQGMNDVQLRRLQLGSGGTDALSAVGRTALETPRDAGNLVSSQGAIASGVLLSAEIAATATYAVNEIGILARVGNGGAEFLLAYWAATAPVAGAVAGLKLLVPATLQVVGAVPDVTVTVSPSLSLSGAQTYLGLTDTPAALGSPGSIPRVNGAGDALEHVAPAVAAPPPGLVALADRAIVAWDVAANPNARLILGGNRTMAAPTNAVEGRHYLLTVQQDGTGNRRLAWNAAYEFDGIGFSGSPTLADAAGARTKFGFTSEAGKMRCLGRVVGF